jgi:hypothetical protein
MEHTTQKINYKLVFGVIGIIVFLAFLFFSFVYKKQPLLTEQNQIPTITASLRNRLLPALQSDQYETILSYMGDPFTLGAGLTSYLDCTEEGRAIDCDALTPQELRDQLTTYPTDLRNLKSALELVSFDEFVSNQESLEFQNNPLRPECVESGSIRADQNTVIVSYTGGVPVIADGELMYCTEFVQTFYFQNTQYGVRLVNIVYTN